MQILRKDFSPLKLIMKNKVIKIVISIFLAVCIIAAGIFYYINSKFVYNAETATGNTAGNLNNGGLFSEYNGKIYFSNPYDDGHLYVMDSDCSNARLLNSDTAGSINVCGNYIYYVKNNYSRNSIVSNDRVRMYGVYRTDLKGNNSDSLYETLSGISSLYGNYLYYQHYSDTEPLSFYRTKIDGSEETKLSDIPINPASIYNGKIYFSNPNNDNYIAAYNTDTGAITTVYEANSYMVDAADNYIYYIDLSKNYSLVRLNLSNNTVELLFEPDDGKVIRYNRYGSKIFFIVEGQDAGLYRMNINGTQIESIAAGNISSVSCTSQYTFFQYYNNETSLYRIPTNGVITKIEEITIKKDISGK